MSAFTGIEPRISMGDYPPYIKYANAMAIRFIERFAPGYGLTHQAILQHIQNPTTYEIEYAHIVTSPQKPLPWDKWKEEEENLSLTSEEQEEQYLALILMYRDQLAIYGGLDRAKTELKRLGEKMSTYITDPKNELTDFFLPRADDTDIESGDIREAIRRDITTFKTNFPAGSENFIRLATFFQSYSDGIQLIAQGEKSTTVTQITKVVNYLEKLTGMFDEFINVTINWAKKQAGYAQKDYRVLRKSIFGTKPTADVDMDTIDDSQVVIQVAKVSLGLLDDGMTFDKSEFEIEEQINIILLDLISVEIYNEFVAHKIELRHFLKKLLKIKHKLQYRGAPIDLPERTRRIRNHIITLLGIDKQTPDVTDSDKILDNIIRLASNNNLPDNTPVKVKYIGTPQPKHQRDDKYWANLSREVMASEKEWGPLHAEVASAAIQRAQKKKQDIAAKVIADRLASGRRVSSRHAVVDQEIQSAWTKWSQGIAEAKQNLFKITNTAVISDPDVTSESISDKDYDMDMEARGGKRNTKKQKKNQKKKTMKAPHKRTIKKRKRRKNKTSKNRS